MTIQLGPTAILIKPGLHKQVTLMSCSTTCHHHGHWLGLYCQMKAQEITLEVILCKYSRHCGTEKKTRQK